jgi:hypothetical protein
MAKMTATAVANHLYPLHTIAVIGNFPDIFLLVGFIKRRPTGT